MGYRDPFASAPIDDSTVSRDGVFSSAETVERIAAAAPGGDSLPIADPTGLTVDTTTYDNTVTGSGKLNVMVFPADQAVFAVALEGDAFPRWLFLSDSTDGFYMGDGTYDPYAGGGHGAAISVQGDGILNLLSSPAEVNLDPPNVLGDASFPDGDTGPVVTDKLDGHTYRLGTTNGVPTVTLIT